MANACHTHGNGMANAAQTHGKRMGNAWRWHGTRRANAWQTQGKRMPHARQSNRAAQDPPKGLSRMSTGFLGLSNGPTWGSKGRPREASGKLWRMLVFCFRSWTRMPVHVQRCHSNALPVPTLRQVYPPLGGGAADVGRTPYVFLRVSASRGDPG